MLLLPMSQLLLLKLKLLQVAVPSNASVRAMLVAVAAPSTGVTSVGVLANTKAPVPVSSEITPASSEDDVAASAEILLVV
jgi:hypothetical protein